MAFEMFVDLSLETGAERPRIFAPAQHGSEDVGFFFRGLSQKLYKMRTGLDCLRISLK